jgi:hypothetical protein
MRKIISLVILFVFTLAFAFFNACKKKVENLDEGALADKVNSWLDKQKLPRQPNQSSNIELLRKNLDLSNIHYEQLNKKEKFLVIPILENYKQLKKVENSAILMLVVVVDEFNKIERGNIAMYLPQTSNENFIPVGTFSNLYNNKTVQANGLIRFLSVSGRWLYQYRVKSGRIFSFGCINQGENSTNAKNNSTEHSAGFCVDWWLVTTYYENGVPVYTEREWVARTCYGCDDGDFMSFCPPDYSGGSTDPVIDCCVPDQNATWLSQPVSIPIATSPGPESTDPTTGVITKTWYLEWVYNDNSLLYWHWRCISHETATLEKINNVWKFTQLVHNSNSIDGTTPPCVEFDSNITIATPTLESDNTRAKMTLAYTSSFRITCIPGTNASYSTGSSSNDWYAN